METFTKVFPSDEDSPRFGQLFYIKMIWDAIKDPLYLTSKICSQQTMDLKSTKQIAFLSFDKSADAYW